VEAPKIERDHRKEPIMPRIDRNGVCATCDGRIRMYPRVGMSPAYREQTEYWSHIDREDWIDNPHKPEPTEESLRKAGLSHGEG
jgi:hypothetical protein